MVARIYSQLQSRDRKGAVNWRTRVNIAGARGYSRHASPKQFSVRFFRPPPPLIRSKVFERIGIGDWDRLESRSQSPACDRQAGRKEAMITFLITVSAVIRAITVFGDSPPKAEIADTRGWYSNRPWTSLEVYTAMVLVGIPLARHLR